MMLEPAFVFIASWLVPGSGHFLLGQRWRGVAFCAAIAATFAFGLVITEGWCVSPSEHRLAFFAQVFAGLPFVAGYLIDMAHQAPVRVPLGATITVAGMSNAVIAALDLGLVFTMVAGLLNLLLALDAADRAGARKEARP
jgi:hypothetical protein